MVLLRSPGLMTGHVWSDGDEAQSFSYPVYKGLRESNSVFPGMLARFAFSRRLSPEHGQPSAAPAELVSGNYLTCSVLRPALGGCSWQR